MLITSGGNVDDNESVKSAALLARLYTGGHSVWVFRFNESEL